MFLIANEQILAIQKYVIFAFFNHPLTIIFVAQNVLYKSVHFLIAAYLVQLEQLAPFI